MTSHEFLPVLARNFDWEAFRATTLTFTVEYLSLCSKIGIDPYTLGFATKLCNQFHIPSSGKQNIAQAAGNTSIARIEAISRAGVAEQILKLIHVLASSEPGLAFLGVCSVIGNYYTIESNVEIFSSLVIESAVPEDLVPTVQAWETLMPLFEGLQGPPSFGELVDSYTALGSQDLISDATEYESAGGRELQHGSAFSAVSALMSMSLVTKGTVYRGQGPRSRISWLPDITSCGGMDVGWEAAAAEWIFGLKIELLEEIMA
jgi:hypothetical protein